MFHGRYHKNYSVVQAANAAKSGNIQSFGVANLWYDASRYQYVTPTGLSNTGQTTNLLSRFAGGPGLSTKYFGSGNSTSFSLPNFYRTYTALASSGGNAVSASAFTAYIAPGTAITCTGSIAPKGDGGPNGTLTVTANTSTGIVVGMILTSSAGTVPANTWVSANLTGTSTSSSSTWTITCNAGTAIPTIASGTITLTPIVMTVTAVTGILNVNNQITHATTSNITTETYITAQLTGTTGSTGTYLVSLSQTKGSSGSPIAGYIGFFNYANFDGNDGYRVAIPTSNVLTGMTIFCALRVGNATGTVGIMSTDHGVGSSGGAGPIAIGRNNTTYTYKAPGGATATGSIAVITSNWVIHTLVFDGTQSANASKFVSRINGTQSTLTFTGTVDTQTADPGTYTIASANVSGIAVTGGVATVTFTTANSTPFNIGQSITLASWTNTGTATINGTYTVTACTATTVSFALSGTLGTIGKGSVAGIPMVNLYMDSYGPATIGGTSVVSANASSHGLLLGELIIYNSALPLVDITAVETTLKNKWLGTN